MFLTGNFTSISFVDFKQIPFSIADGEAAPQDLIWAADEVPLLATYKPQQ